MKPFPWRQLLFIVNVSLLPGVSAVAEEVRNLHPNGQLKEVFQRENGWIQGLYREYDDTGRLIREIPHKDNRWHGTAKFYHSNGNLREQTEYALGVKHGTKLTFYESGAKHEQIPYRKDWVQGSYLEFNESGMLIREIPHKDNEWHGIAKFYHPNGELSEEQSRVTGKLDGIKRTFFASGAVHEEIPYKDGWVQGTYREFDEFGELVREIPHTDNEWHGHVKFYHPNGELSEEQSRVNGRLDGIKRTYFVSGAAREEVPYKEGWVQGVYREWSESGALVREIPHTDNEWHGIARWFHPNGELAEETPFWMGKRHGVSRKFDRAGKLVSSTTHVAPDAPADADARIAAATPPSTVGAPPPSPSAAGVVESTPPSPSSAPAPPALEPAVARSTDPETGITTTATSRPDGSRVVTKTDRNGNVIESSVYPPNGSEPAFASTVDPATGIMTTAVAGPDGARAVAQTEKIEGDGFEKIIETDDRGNRTETIVPADGSPPTITETDADGNTRTITPAADGGFTVVETTPEGYVNETKRDAAGGTVTLRRDIDGNPMEKITRTPDGREVREDAMGNKVETTTDHDGLVTETKTDRRGNTMTVVTDAQGNQVSRTEERVTPVDPGQEYFEDVLGGTDWENVPPSLRARYASSEQAIRDGAAMQAMRREQEAEREREDAAIRADSETRSRETDEKLAAIQAEEQAAQEAIAKREARETRARAIEASHEKAKDLQRQYDEAVARGDKAGARRIMAEQDKHHDESMELLAFTEEEQAEADRKQSVRNRLFDEIVGSARAEAATKVDQDWEQDLKDTVTSGTQYVSVGSQMQQETKESTRRANHELAFAEAKKARIEKRLQDPNLSRDERDILTDMLDLAAVQEAGAAAQLSSNANLTTAGYAIDVGMLASGGLANAGVAMGAKVTARVAGEKAAEKLVAAVAERGITDLGRSGVLAATERLAGKETAEALAAKAAAAREAMSAAGERLSQAGSNAATRVLGEEGVARVANVATKVSDTLSTDLATGAVGESTLIRAAVEDMAVGATVDTGMQLATTGTVDVGEVVRGAVAGGVVAGGTAAFPGGAGAPGGTPSRTAPSGTGAIPLAPARTGGGLASAVEAPSATAAAPRPAGLEAPPVRVEPPSPIAPAPAASNTPAVRPTERPRADPTPSRTETPAVAGRPRATNEPVEAAGNVANTPPAPTPARRQPTDPDTSPPTPPPPARVPVDHTPVQPARTPDTPASSGPPLPVPRPPPGAPDALPTLPPIIGGMREFGTPVVQPSLSGGSAPPVPRPEFYDAFAKPGAGGQPSLRDRALGGNPRESADARAALAKILDTEGVPSWPEMAKTIDAQDPAVRDQMLEMRGWVWDQLTARYGDKIKATGSSGKFSNDLDFSNLSSTPGKQLLEIDNFLANEIDLGNGVRGFGPDWRQKLNMDTFLDPQLIHIYDKVGDPAARARILHDPDLFRKGDLIAMEQMHRNMSPEAFNDFLRTALPEHPDLNHSSFGEFLEANLGAPSTRQELLPKLDDALARFNRTGDPAAAREIVDLQMQLNRITPDAYPSPGAVKSILTINEGMFDIPPGTKIDPPSGRSIESLNGGQTPGQAGEIKRLANKLEGDPATAADAAYLKKKFSELQAGVPFDPVERYQNVVNNIAYFEHQVHAADGNPLVALQRYQTSKYESRVLGNVSGLSGELPPPGGLVDQIDDAVNRFYKERGPEIERYFGREGQTMAPADRAALESEAGEFLEVMRAGNNALARRARKEAFGAVEPGADGLRLDGGAPPATPPTLAPPGAFGALPAGTPGAVPPVVRGDRTGTHASDPGVDSRLETTASQDGRASVGMRALDPQAMQGRTATVNSGGASIEIRFGKFINDGSFNQVFHADGRPGKVVRVSKGPSEHLEARVDLSGRRALESSREALAGRLEFVEAETFTSVQSSDPQLNGRTISIMDVVDTRAAEQLKANPDRQPTAGQAIAYDRGVRALNNAGYAILDGHTANYYFRQAGGPDEWVMVIIDPGGIVPAKGLDPASARRLQALVDDPPNRQPSLGGPSPGNDRGPIAYVSKALQMGPTLDELVDASAMGLGNITEFLEAGEHGLPLFKPAGAEDFPDVRKLFGVPDAEAEAAYEALRRSPGNPRRDG